MSKKMDVTSVKAMLQAQKADALSANNAAQLTGERERAMKYYLGDMSEDMPAQDGRSRAVSTDVADTIEGLMPPLMDIFAGSDEVVRFEPQLFFNGRERIRQSVGRQVHLRQHVH